MRALVATTVRSGSLRSAWFLHRDSPGVAEVRVRGLPGRFRFRTGTSDARLLRVLVERGLPPEYELPDDLELSTILDIGANIGTVTAALARRYPRARIFAFEPLPENFVLLKYNTAALANVVALPFGLGARTRCRSYTRSDDPWNFGGGGFHGGCGIPPRGLELLPVVSVAEALAALGIQAVDLIKVDTEGAEHEILTSFPPSVLITVQAIVGELHSKPGDDELLNFLAKSFTVTRILRRGRTRWFQACRPTPQPTAEPGAPLRPAAGSLDQTTVAGGEHAGR
mgnify:CR=1 FL=1